MSFQLISTFITVCFLWAFMAIGSAQPNFGSFGFTTPSSVENFLSGLGGSSTCPYSPTITCSSGTYRTIDGSCNDVSAPYNGKSETPYIRTTGNLYQNYQNIPRTKGFTGLILPTPRRVSLDYFTESDNPQMNLTLLTAFFARFIEHDLYKTKLSDGSSCCSIPPPVINSCSNIELSGSDPFFATYQRVCLPKANTVSSLTVDCKEGVSQQINEHTHFLDLSNIYGSTKTVSDSLRTKTNGLLNVSDTNNLLPKLDFSKCVLPSPNTNSLHCFMAGDSRVNTDPLIMAIYTMLVRAHNDIAQKLKDIISPTADDETLFQEARKILMAMYQHIVYNEFLVALDSTTTLKPVTPGGSTNKSPQVKPDITNIFSIAYTSMVDSMMPQNVTIEGTFKNTEELWFNPQSLWNNDGVKEVVKAMQTEKSGQIDRYMVEDLTNKYLQLAPGTGTDKVALNFQQSRENGMINYYIMNAYINKVFTVTDYVGLTNLEAASVTELKKLYPLVYDLELLPGLLGEKHSSGMEYGPMMKSIIDTQFKNLKEGDSFYYDHANIFTAAQLAEIKKTTMAKLLCLYAPLDNTTALAFHEEEAGVNEEVECGSIPETDICVWATISWSNWVSSPCLFGTIFSTRECLLGSGSLCKCSGSPIKFESCPFGLAQALVDTAEINMTYHMYYDSQGRPINPNSTPSAADILNIASSG